MIKENTTVTLMNAHAKFVNGFIKLEIDKWAIVKPAAPEDEVKEVDLTNNCSEVEYEMTRVDADGKETDQAPLKDDRPPHRGRGNYKGSRGRGGDRGNYRGGRGGRGNFNSGS